jgi:heme exporter protein D
MSGHSIDHVGRLDQPDTSVQEAGAFARRGRPFTAFALLVLVVLVFISMSQHERLRVLQKQDKQAHYAERLRAAQVIVENELLAAAALTSMQSSTRERAVVELKKSPR